MGRAGGCSRQCGQPPTGPSPRAAPSPSQRQRRRVGVAAVPGRPPAAGHRQRRPLGRRGHLAHVLAAAWGRQLRRRGRQSAHGRRADHAAARGGQLQQHRRRARSCSGRTVGAGRRRRVFGRAACLAGAVVASWRSVSRDGAAGGRCARGARGRQRGGAGEGLGGRATCSLHGSGAGRPARYVYTSATQAVAVTCVADGLAYAVEAVSHRKLVGQSFTAPPVPGASGDGRGGEGLPEPRPAGSTASNACKRKRAEGDHS